MLNEVNRLTDKLKVSATGLLAQEQNVLEWLVDRARKTPVQILEEDLRNASGGRDLAESLGWSDLEAGDANIGWSKGIGIEEG